jgi:hypothetical protein
VADFADQPAVDQRAQDALCRALQRAAGPGLRSLPGLRRLLQEVRDLLCAQIERAVAALRPVAFDGERIQSALGARLVKKEQLGQRLPLDAPFHQLFHALRGGGVRCEEPDAQQGHHVGAALGGLLGQDALLAHAHAKVGQRLARLPGAQQRLHLVEGDAALGQPAADKGAGSLWLMHCERAPV